MPTIKRLGVSWSCPRLSATDFADFADLADWVNLALEVVFTMGCFLFEFLDVVAML